MAASVANGISPAHLPKKTVMSRSTTACVIPATGVRPPFFTLVAVRAMAPVAGIPPNNGVTMLATPCATSSMLDRCLDPIMPSATTADSSDSMAPSIAMVKAGATRFRMSANASCGNTGRGRAELSSPNRLPTVSTGRCNNCTATVVTMSATNGEGRRRLIRGHPTTMTSATTPTPSAAGVNEIALEA